MLQIRRFGRRAAVVGATLAICGTVGVLVAGSASAHSGDVTVNQNCDTWSATVTLAHNVTVDRTVVVTSSIPGTIGLTGHYDTSYGQIWHQTGAAVAHGTVTLTIYNGNTVEFTAHATLPTPEDCVTTSTSTSTTSTTTTEPTTTTTTTVPATTTTRPTSSSTTVPHVTTVPKSTTTAPHITTTTVPRPPLPFTGSDSGTFAAIGVGILGAGLALAKFGKRTR